MADSRSHSRGSYPTYEAFVAALEALPANVSALRWTASHNVPAEWLLRWVREQRNA